MSFGSSMMMGASGNSALPTAAYDPVAGVGWLHAYYVSGDEMVALGYAEDDPVNAWPDEIGSLDLTSNGGGARPLFKPNALDGYGTLYFDGSDYIRTASGVLSLAQPYTVVVIGSLSVTGAVRRRVFASRSGSGASILRHESSSTWRAGAGTNVDHSTASVNDVYHLWVFYGDGASSSFEVDGAADDPISAGTATMDGFTLGSQFNIGDYWIGGISFVGIYDGDARDDPGWSAFESWTISNLVGL